MQTYKDIELAGIMSLLYGMLLHNVPTRGEVSSPPEISSKTLTVTLVALRLINQIAAVDYKLVQVCVADMSYVTSHSHKSSLRCSH